MKLQLTVNGKVLSSIPVNETLAGNEAYLKAVRRLMLLRHRKDIQPDTQANFLLETSRQGGKLPAYLPLN